MIERDDLSASRGERRLGAAPVRVTVLGNSTGIMVAPMGGPREDLTWPRWLERHLLGAGYAVELDNCSQIAAVITEAVCQWEDVVLRRSPDVVIINYGIAECFSGVMPRPLEDHFHTWHMHQGLVRESYRKVLKRVIWPRLRRFQRRVDKVVDQRRDRFSPKKYAWELRRAIELARSVQSPLVLVMDICPAGERFSWNIPSINGRRDRLVKVVERVVREWDHPDVRFVEATPIVEEMGIDVALPDGLHFSAEGHRRVGAMIADEVLPWLEGREWLRASAMPT